MNQHHTHPYRLIGFAGPARVGKTSAAALLGQVGWRVMSFADPLRDWALTLRPDWSLADLCGPDKEVVRGHHSPRSLLRGLGDGLNALAPDAILNHARARIERAFLIGERVVFDDVRYEHEADLIRGLGGRIAHIQRHGITYRRDHSSEEGIRVLPALPGYPGDAVIENPGTVEGYFARITLALRSTDAVS